jgi:hypothetical protein
MDLDSSSISRIISSGSALLDFFFFFGFLAGSDFLEWLFELLPAAVKRFQKLVIFECLFTTFAVDRLDELQDVFPCR